MATTANQTPALDYDNMLLQPTIQLQIAECIKNPKLSVSIEFFPVRITLVAFHIFDTNYRRLLTHQTNQ